MNRSFQEVTARYRQAAVTLSHRQRVTRLCVCSRARSVAVQDSGQDAALAAMALAVSRTPQVSRAHAL
jgi:hypothetical protein